VQEPPRAEPAANQAGKGVRRIAPLAEVSADRRITDDNRIACAQSERAWKTVDVSSRASMGRHIATSLAAMLVAAVISFGLLGSVAWLFQRDGAPLQHVVAAERACADRAYVSERDACMRTDLAAGAPARPVQACAAAPPRDSPRMEC
jgi:hypothetical protein